MVGCSQVLQRGAGSGSPLHVAAGDCQNDLIAGELVIFWGSLRVNAFSLVWIYLSAFSGPRHQPPTDTLSVCEGAVRALIRTQQPIPR